MSYFISYIALPSSTLIGYLFFWDGLRKFEQLLLVKEDFLLLFILLGVCFSIIDSIKTFLFFKFWYKPKPSVNYIIKDNGDVEYCIYGVYGNEYGYCTSFYIYKIIENKKEGNYSVNRTYCGAI